MDYLIKYLHQSAKNLQVISYSTGCAAIKVWGIDYQRKVLHFEYIGGIIISQE